MKPGANFFVVTVARFYTPLIVLFALSLLAVRAPAGGVGFVAGLAGALALVVHALVFGADAARKAVPPALARALLAVGLIAAAAGAGAPRWPFAPQVLEAGLFAVTVAAVSLVLAVLIGRAPTLRDETM
jgi:multisubunit Na+/H+ antiporter MnhB subunit